MVLLGGALRRFGVFNLCIQMFGGRPLSCAGGTVLAKSSRWDSGVRKKRWRRRLGTWIGMQILPGFAVRQMDVIEKDALMVCNRVVKENVGDMMDAAWLSPSVL